MTEPLEPSPKLWLKPLEEVWFIVPAELEPALEPLKGQAVCWGSGVFPSWPPLGWLVESQEQADGLKTLLKPTQPQVIVLHRADTAGTMGDLALTLDLLPLAGGVMGWMRGAAGTRSAFESTSLATMLGILHTAMSVGLYRKLPSLCSVQELLAVHTEALRTSSAALKALNRPPEPADYGQPGAPAVQSLQPQEPTGPSAATAPLQLPPSPSPVQASMLQRPMGYADRVAGERLQTVQWWEGWYGHMHRYL